MGLKFYTLELTAQQWFIYIISCWNFSSFITPVLADICICSIAKNIRSFPKNLLEYYFLNFIVNVNFLSDLKFEY